MNQFVALGFDFQSTAPVCSPVQILRHMGWLRDFLALCSEVRTRRILSTLDRATLEDIGVPHHDTSPRAGALERYPRVITIRKRSC